jgi:hypothetical protein
MPRPYQLVGQIAAYLAFVVVIGYLSVSPVYQHVDPGAAVIKLIFSHATTRVQECRTLSPEELRALAVNMRTPTECPRERHPMTVELVMDDTLIFSGMEQPTGLWNDGAATVYERFTVRPGRYRLTLRVRDTGRVTGFDYEHTDEVQLQPRQNVVLSFNREFGLRLSGG